MPYEGEDPPYVEPDPELNDLSHKVVGAAIEVARLLGPGLDEKVYESALCVELGLRGIPFERQVVINVRYKDQPIGTKTLDLVVGKRLIVENKSVETLNPLHKAQLLTYLRLTHRKLGLLINFNCFPLKDGIKRVVNNSGC